MWKLLRWGLCRHLGWCLLDSKWIESRRLSSWWRRCRSCWLKISRLWQATGSKHGIETIVILSSLKISKVIVLGVNKVIEAIILIIHVDEHVTSFFLFVGLDLLLLSLYFTRFLFLRFLSILLLLALLLLLFLTTLSKHQHWIILIIINPLPLDILVVDKSFGRGSIGGGIRLRASEVRQVIFVHLLIG